MNSANPSPISGSVKIFPQTLSGPPQEGSDRISPIFDKMSENSNRLKNKLLTLQQQLRESNEKNGTENQFPGYSEHVRNPTTDRTKKIIGNSFESDTFVKPCPSTSSVTYLFTDEKIDVPCQVRIQPQTKDIKLIDFISDHTKTNRSNCTMHVSSPRPKDESNGSYAPFLGHNITSPIKSISSPSVSPVVSSCKIPQAKTMAVTPTPTSGLTLSAFCRPEATVRLTDCPLDYYIHQQYHMARVLGHGATSTVRLAIRRSDGKRFAVKCIPKYVLLHDKRRLEEIVLLKALNHPNIVLLHDVFETDNEVQLVVEYCPGGELFNAIRGKQKSNQLDFNDCMGYCEEDAAKIISTILGTLRYLHFLGIAHRDVKPENILLMSLNGGEIDVKLSDFGSARLLHPQGLAIILSGSHYGPFLPVMRTGPFGNTIVDEVQETRTRAYSRVGSDYYTAPEVNSGKGYDISADLYSLGVTMYIILCGRFPPAPLDLANDPLFQHLSAGAKDLIESLLDRDPVRRITAAEALRHDWIMQHSCATNGVVTNKKNLRQNSFVTDDENRRVKRARMEIGIDALPAIFYGSNVFSDDVVVVVDGREENDDSSREFNLRPTCFV